MENKIKCGACNKELVNDQGSTNFTCPHCGKGKVIRCSQCRKLGTKWKCPTCDYEGPN